MIFFVCVQGLTSKTTLILTVMKHNDRLVELLGCVLRPYNLVASPAPQSSLFVDIDQLITWYSLLVNDEMLEQAKKILTVITRLTGEQGSERVNWC